jgi:hypothetical protein
VFSILNNLFFFRKHALNNNQFGRVGQMRQRTRILGIFCTFLSLAVLSGAQTTALVGGTLIDLTRFGRSTNDVPDAVVLIQDGKFTAAGSFRETPIPKGARIVNAHGKFLIPGLIDGFGALRTQGFANAYLLGGVTTVYVPTIPPHCCGDGEAIILRTGRPSPRIFLGAPVTGYSIDGIETQSSALRDVRLHGRRLSDGQLIARVDQLSAQGIRGITIGFDVWPDQFDLIVAEAKAKHLAILAEPGFSSYAYAIRSGAEALVHNDHYQMELAPASAKLERADGNGANAYGALCALDIASGVVNQFGGELSRSRAALMPTLAIEATADLLDVPNPWKAPTAALVLPSDLDVPVDPKTGASGWLSSLPPERRDYVRNCGLHKEQIDARLYQLGARFLAASAASTYGVMPGSGLHLELELLHRIGLTPRESLAAATDNYATVYGWNDVGRIEVGRDADLLILSEDPRQNVLAVDAIDTVILGGKILNSNHLLNRRQSK